MDNSSLYCMRRLSVYGVFSAFLLAVTLNLYSACLEIIKLSAFLCIVV